MCAYLSKSEVESSDAMKKATHEIYESRTTATERMKSNTGAYRTQREMPVQKAAAMVLTKAWLNNIFICRYICE